MLVKLKNKTYKGISDGTSLTDDRCRQILSVYKYTQSLGKRKLNYKQFQHEVANAKLFGGQTVGESAIRTIFPLLSKIGMVDYSKDFYACDLFTDIGSVFMETYSALCVNEDLDDKALQDELDYCLSLIQQYGLLIMNEQDDYSHHGIWLACSILKEEKEIYWPEFLYILYLTKERSLTLKNSILKVKENRENSVFYEYYNEKNESIANTSYSYIHSYLLEANIVRDIDQKHSQLQAQMYSFIEGLNLEL